MAVKYRVNFSLDCDVLDFEEAKNYLLEEDMVKYFEFADSFGVLKIDWILESLSSGYISVVSKDELDSGQLDVISSWIQGQCSDGLGEGFEQQDFACYYNELEDICECEDILECDCEEQEEQSASFNRYSSYKLERVVN